VARPVGPGRHREGPPEGTLQDPFEEEVAMTTLAAGLPPLPPERAFVVPEVDTFTLANGLEVQTVTVPGLPLVTLRLVIRGGRVDDGPAAPGFAELLADALEEGTTGRSALQLFDLLQDAGGDLKGDASTDATIVAAHGLASSLPRLAESSGTPTFRGMESAA
jgi:hypothetical protein